MLKNLIVAMLFGTSVCFANPYVLSTENIPVRTQFGDCVHSSEWTKENARKSEFYVSCEKPKKIVVKTYETIFFDFDSDELKESEENKIVAFVKRNSENLNEVSYRAIGYADEIGKENYNFFLSEDRAKSVTFSILLKKFPCKFYGQGSLYCLDKNESCFEKNRKVIIEAKGWQYVD